ncbi:MAG: hypothetical protein HYY04_18055 [Chloroflexi bacterium]|nr:hypothetical protein [Chloroflexota bacterium]
MEIIDVRHRPELRAFADHIRKTKRVAILRDADEEIATVTPAQPTRRRRLPKGRPLTKDDPLFGLIGIGRSGRSDISSNKHKYLAEADRSQKT